MSEPRDLDEDLKLCEAASPGPFEFDGKAEDFVAVITGDGKHYVSMHEPGCSDIVDERMVCNWRMFAAAREGWPHAVRRALAAEKTLREGLTPESALLAWHLHDAIKDAEIARLKGIIEGMAARIASQSDQLSRRAMKNTDGEGSD